MKKQVPLTAVLAIALVIVAVVGYFLLVKPKQDRSAQLDEEIAELETKLAATAPSRPGKPKVEINVADVFRLAKAMPDREDMPGIVLELNSIALSAGVRFASIQPQPAVVKGSYYAVPITVAFDGNYFDLTDFLYRLRNLVSVRDGVLDASGRLYTLDALGMQEGEDGFPEIRATLTLSAYSFGNAPDSPDAAAGATGGTTQTTTTTTTQTTTTGPAPTTSSPPADATGNGSEQAVGGNG